MKKENEHIKECEKAYNAFKKNRVIQGIEITHIPDKPPIESIDNYGLPKSERKFKQIKLPEIINEYDNKGNIIDSKFKFNSLDEELRFLRFLKKLRRSGYWFFNGNKLEYITGLHWFYMSFWKMPVKKKVNGQLKKRMGSPNFSDADIDYFLFLKEAEIDPKCFGVMLVSGRRASKTERAICWLYDECTSNPSSVNGIQAQNGEIAESVFKRLIRGWRNLPEHVFFRPIHAGNSNPAKTLDFSPPKQISSKHKAKAEKKALYSYIDYRATKATAYDSEGLHRLYVDEASKMDTVDISELYGVVRETLADGSDATGKILITSTCENIGGKTLAQFEDLWEDSNQNEYGRRTSSGLWRYFQPATRAYRGIDDEDSDGNQKEAESAIDEWGYSKEHISKKILQKERDKRKGKKLIRFKRKYPFTIEEAFTADENTNGFPVHKIQEQQRHNRTISKKTQRGNFVWRNGEKWTSVVWRTDPEGLWETYWHPSNPCQVRTVSGQRQPAGFEVVGGVDPYDHKTTSDGSNSDGSCHFFRKPHPEDVESNCFVAEFCHRLDTPEAFWEECLKAAIYYNAPMLIENNKVGILNFLRQGGYYGYAMARPKQTHTKWSASRQVEKGIPLTGDAARGYLVDAMSNYIYDNIGFNEDKETMGRCYFDSLLKDWLRFNPNKWTDYDRSVSSMLCIVAAQRPQKEKPKAKVAQWLRKYDNSGVVSKLI